MFTGILYIFCLLLFLGVGVAIGIGIETLLVVALDPDPVLYGMFDNEEVKTALEACTAEVRVRIAVDPAVKGNVHVIMHNLPFEAALDILCAGCRADWVKVGDHYQVFNLPKPGLSVNAILGYTFDPGGTLLVKGIYDSIIIQGIDAPLCKACMSVEATTSKILDLQELAGQISEPWHVDKQAKRIVLETGDVDPETRKNIRITLQVSIPKTTTLDLQTSTKDIQINNVQSPVEGKPK